ncbi:hypothetical protein BXU10_08630 [Flavobacterium sp. LM4]|nr:hypothetical protein BXU10_08630 [Flavobacterium sp. LM4]
MQIVKTKNNQAKLELKKKNKSRLYFIFLQTLNLQKPICNLYFSLGIVYNEILKLTPLYLFLLLFC